jgi:hypothetical protein
MTPIIYKKTAFIVLALCAAHLLSAQFSTFLNYYRGSHLFYYPQSVAAIADGYVVVGESQPDNVAPSEAFLLKTNFAGAIEWEKSWGGSGYTSSFTDVVATSDGGFVALGSVLVPDSTFSLIRLLKMDKDGNFVWERSWGRGTGDVFPLRVLALNDGFLISGVSLNFNPNFAYGLFVKTNEQGNEQWRTGITTNINDFSFRYTAQVLSDTTFYICGTSSAPTGIMEVAQSNGQVIQVVNYGNTGQARFTSMRATSDGNFLLAGEIQSSQGTSEAVFLHKLTPELQVIWTKKWLNTAGYTPELLDESTVLLKKEQDGAIIARLNPNGAVTEARNFLRPFSVLRRNEEGGLLSVGQSNPFNLYLLKTWPTGALPTCDPSIFDIATENYDLPRNSQSFALGENFSFDKSADVIAAETSGVFLEDYCGVTSGVDQVPTMFPITISPNPVRGVFTLKTEAGMSGQFLLVDPQGRVVQTGHYLAPSQTIAVGDLPVGSYTLILEADNGLNARQMLYIIR